MKKFISLALSAFLAMSLMACSSAKEETTETETTTEVLEVAESDLDYIKEKGTMVIGYTLYEPMNFEDPETGELTGFDTELATIVCEKLGVTPEFVLINWDTKEVELSGKSIDTIWNGFTLNPEREANMACTNPYVKNAQVIVTKEGFSYTDTSSLEGMTVVAELGSAGEGLIVGENADENLSKASYIGKSTQVDALLEVKAGTADAAILDLTLANSMTGEGTDFSDVVIVDSLAEEFYGIAFRQNSDARDEVNVILDELLADGTLASLASKYSLSLAE